MKKILFIALGAVCCLAMAMPAMAEIKISGVISIDAYWFNKNKELEAGGVPAGAATLRDDRTEFHIDSYRPLNYIQVAYTNKDATLGGEWRLRQGEVNHTTTGPELYHNFIWWKPMDNLKLTIGEDDTIVGGLGPALPLLGHNTAGTIVMITYGNFHSTAQTGITMESKLTDWLGMEFGIYDPEDDGTAALRTTKGVGGTGLVRPDGGLASEEIDTPRFDIGFPMTFGNLRINPKGTFSSREFDSLAANQEDSYEIWAACLEAKYNYGPLELRAEYAFGENLGDANYSGGTMPNAVSYTDGAGVTRIADAEQDMWWATLNYKFTKKFDVLVGYGEYQGENDVDPTTAADDWDIERTYYGIRFGYRVYPNFIIYPEWGHFERGDDNKIASATTTDFGAEDVYGVQFRLFW